MLISANVQSTAIEECDRSGGSGFITKPIRKYSIIETSSSTRPLEKKNYV